MQEGLAGLSDSLGRRKSRSVNVPAGQKPSGEGGRAGSFAETQRATLLQLREAQREMLPSATLSGDTQLRWDGVLFCLGAEGLVLQDAHCQVGEDPGCASVQNAVLAAGYLG